MTTRRQEFDDALAAHAPDFGVRAGDELRARLGDYFELVERWNTRLHLVAPCAPAEFALRHSLESLAAAPHVAEGATVIDVGSGAGFPVVPCLSAREDVRAVLFESSTRKCVFLREALAALDLKGRATVINSRFEDAEPPGAQALTCRALERFAETLPRLAAWAPAGCALLLFGGATLREAIETGRLAYEARLIPESDQRYLFIVQRGR